MLRLRQVLSSSLCSGLIVLYAVIGRLQAQTIVGKVVAVPDGDDIRILSSREEVRIRLAEIDCPERGQPFFRNAKRFTSSLAFGKTVRVQVREQDRFGRKVGRVTLPDGRSLNHELVKAGYAWWFRRYSDDLSLSMLEMAARTEKAGLWADPHPEPPWEYRARKRKG